MITEAPAPGGVESAVAAILIVDDDEAVLEALEGIITKHFPDVRITCASDSETALSHLEAVEFRVVLSDYRLRAGLDGGALLSRAAGLQPSAARLALAADPDPYIVQMGGRVGFTVLTKPVEEEILLQILRHHLPK